MGPLREYSEAELKIAEEFMQAQANAINQSLDASYQNKKPTGPTIQAAPRTTPATSTWLDPLALRRDPIAQYPAPGMVNQYQDQNQQNYQMPGQKPRPGMGLGGGGDIYPTDISGNRIVDEHLVRLFEESLGIAAKQLIISEQQNQRDNKNQTPHSVGVYDEYSGKLLTEMLAVMKGNPGRPEGAARGATTGHEQYNNKIDTTNLDTSIQLFSQDIEILATMLSQPLTLEVSGDVNVNVTLNGNEWLAGAKDSISRYVGHKITGGINNFIRRGLKDTRVATKTSWSDDDTSSQSMAGNSSGGRMS